MRTSEVFVVAGNDAISEEKRKSNKKRIKKEIKRERDGRSATRQQIGSSRKGLKLSVEIKDGRSTRRGRAQNEDKLLSLFIICSLVWHNAF